MIIGIDPGLSGGISCGNISPFKLNFSLPLPISEFQLSKQKSTIDGRELFSILNPHVGKIKLVVIEAVHAMPEQGVVSTFNFGMGYGIVLGVLAALNLKVLKVSPGVWKSAMNLNRDKQKSLDAAAKLFPEFGHLWRLKKNDGLAESALLVKYGHSILHPFEGLLTPQ